MKEFCYVFFILLFTVLAPPLTQGQITGQRTIQYATAPDILQASNLVKGYSSNYIQTSCENLGGNYEDGSSLITKYNNLHNPVLSIKISQFIIRGICEDAANNMYAIGFDAGITLKVSILKITSTGSILWKRTITQSDNSNVFPPDNYPYDYYKTLVLSNGNILFTCYTGNSRALLLFSPAGLLLNSTDLPANLGDIKEGFNNTLVACYFDNSGFFGSNVTVSGILQLNFNLQIVRSRNILSPSSFFLYAIGVDNTGSYYLCGVDSAYNSTSSAGGIIIKMDSLLNTSTNNTIGFVATDKKNCGQTNSGRYFKFEVKGNTIAVIENLFFPNLQNPITYNDYPFVALPLLNFDYDLNKLWSKNILIKQDTLNPIFMVGDDIIKMNNQYIFSIKSRLKNAFLYYLDTAGNTGNCYSSDANYAVRKFTSTLADTTINRSTSIYSSLQAGIFNIVTNASIIISNECAPLLMPVSYFVTENTNQSDTSILCLNKGVNFIDSSKNDPSVFSWVFPPQADLSNADSTCFPNISNVSFSSIGVFPVQLIACNNYGCDTSIIIIRVINFAPPALGNDTTICSGDSLVLIYTNAANSSHEFTGSNGLYTTADTIIIRENGAYQCTVTSPCGSLTDEITVNFLQKPQAAFGAAIVCDSLKVLFSDSSQFNGNPLLNYHWKFYNAANTQIGSSFAQNPLFEFPGYDSFAVRLIITSANNCAASDSITKIIYLNAKPTVAFTATNICSSLSARFSSNSSVAADTIQTYAWDFGNGQTATDKNPSATFAAFGSQTVKLTVTSSRGCASDTFTQSVLIKDKPVVAINVLKDSVCSNTVFTLSNNATVQGAVINGFKWQLAGNTIGNNTTLNQILAAPALYRYALTAGSDAGCSSDTAFKTITVVGKPTGSFSFTTNCGSLSIPFTASSTVLNDAITQHYWSFGDNSSSSAANPTKTYSNFFDSYNVKYVAVSSVGCAGDTIIQNVLVKDKPTISLVYAGNACENIPFTVQANATVIDASINNQQWWVNDLPVANNNNLLTLTKPAGAYSIKYLATSSKGCSSDTLVNNIVVETLPAVTFATTNTCVGNTVLLQNNSAGNIINYKWQFGNGDSSSAMLPVYQYSAPGNYTIRLNASTANKCTANISQPISIEPKPTAAFSVTESCPGKAISIINNSSGNIIDYNWQTSNGNNFTGSNPAIVFTEQGDYALLLKVTSSFGCNSESSNNIRIKAVQLFTNTDTVAIINQPLQLFAAGAVSYLWQPASVFSNASAVNPVFKAANSGLYPITVEGTTAQGCTGSSSFIISVYSTKAGLVLPNAFSPNGDNTNDLFRLNCAGLQSLSFFRIYNRYGQPIYEQRNCSNSNGWDGKYKGSLQNPSVCVYLGRGGF